VLQSLVDIGLVKWSQLSNYWVTFSRTVSKLILKPSTFHDAFRMWRHLKHSSVCISSLPPRWLVKNCSDGSAFDEVVITGIKKLEAYFLTAHPIRESISHMYYRLCCLAMAYIVNSPGTIRICSRICRIQIDRHHLVCRGRQTLEACRLSSHRRRPASTLRDARGTAWRENRPQLQRESNIYNTITGVAAHSYPLR